MKKVFLLLLTCWLWTGATFAQDTPTGGSVLSVRPVSTEVTTVNGSLTFALVIKSYRTADLQATISLEPDAHFAGATTGVVSGLWGPVAAGDSVVQNLTLTYDQTQLPHNLQPVDIRLTDTNSGETIGLASYYIYFTPYGTIECWNQDDFENLRRIWNEGDFAGSTPDRVPVVRSEIPVSDLTDEEWADSDFPKSYISVAGLGYIIPMRHITEEDEDGLGRGTGKNDGKSADRTANFQTWRGTISGEVRTLLGGAAFPLPITGIRVVIMDRDDFGVGCIGIDDELATTHTDNNGNFSVFVESHQRATGRWWVPSCSREGNELELYVIIMARTASGSIRVCERIRSKVRETTVGEGNPTPWRFNAAGQNLNLGTFNISPGIIKPQLLHWANQSARLANQELASTGFSLPNNFQDPLKIYLYPIVQSKGGMFIPGGYKAAIVSTGALIPILGPVASLLLTIDLTNDDCLYIGSDSQQDENLAYHEFGHYLMWKMQNEAWLNPLEASFATHGDLYNGGNPKIAWTEGWADAFSTMADSYCFRYDNEAGTQTGGRLNHERRTFDGNRPERIPRPVRNSPNRPTLTHGFVSEFNIAAVIHDLFDGTTNFALNNGNAGRQHLDQEGGFINDRVELSFADICRPLLDNNSGGIFGFFSSRVIQSIADYHRVLIAGLGCEQRAAITRLFGFNEIGSFDDPITDRLNSDAIAASRSVRIERFTAHSGTDYESEGFGNYLFGGLDVPLIGGSEQFFNLASPAPNGFEALTDNLRVTESATLFFNANRGIGFRFNTSGTPTPGANFWAQLCGGMQLRVNNGGRVQLGDAASGNTATVTTAVGSLLDVQAGGILVVENGSTLIIAAGGTLVIRNGGSLVVNGTGQVHIAAGAYLCVETQANLTFAPTSQLFIDVNSLPGTDPALNPALDQPALACNTQLNMCSQFVSTGSGSGPGSAFTVGTRNEALLFDGVDDVVEIDNAAALNVAAGQPFTYEAYIRSNLSSASPPMQLILSKRNVDPFTSNTGEGMMFGIWFDGRLWAQLFHRNLGFVHTVNYNLLDGRCHHVAMSRDAANLFRLYVDGVVVEEARYNYSAESAGALRIGTDLFTPQPFNGDIGEVRMWNQARSPEQLLASSQGAGISGAEPNLVAYWDMDGATGSTTLPGRTTTNVINGTLGAGLLTPGWVDNCALTCRANGVQFRTAPNAGALPGRSQPGSFLSADSSQTRRTLHVLVYPNPTSGPATALVASGTTERVTYTIRDLRGRLLFRKQNHPAQQPLPIGEDLAPGVYFLQATTRTASKTVKFVKLDKGRY